MPTRNRIFSYLDAHPEHMSGGSCWFKMEDGCLMNPQILGGIKQVLITSANELQYVDNVFPLIQIGSTHQLVDERDLLVNGTLGVRPSVAVERRTDAEFALVFAGDIAKDSRETVGGFLHGFAENEQMVVKLIEHLAQSIDTPEKRSYDFRVISSGRSALATNGNRFVSGFARAARRGRRIGWRFSLRDPRWSRCAC